MKALPGFLLQCILLAIAGGKLREYSESLMPFRVGSLMAKPADRTIAMPIARVRRSQVADTWHARRGNRRLHEGEDIFAPAGTPVYSATSGVVVRAGDAGIGGNAVSILGAGGVVYYYAHLSRFADGIHTGQDVTPDTVIGYVGNTGNAKHTPSHLHFGVYAPGGPIDPLPLLADRSPRADQKTNERRTEASPAMLWRSLRVSTPRRALHR